MDQEKRRKDKRDETTRIKQYQPEGITISIEEIKQMKIFKN